MVDEETEEVPEADEENDEEEPDSDGSSDKFDSFRDEEENPTEEREDPSVEERPSRDRIAPGWHRDYEMNYMAYALNATSYVENLPNSVAEARKRSDWDKWQVAINEEMASLLKNRTWTLTKLPGNRVPITNKWVFKVKRGVNGQPDRYKARLVARGFSQRRGFDYNETYSPVAKLDTLRTVLALANQENMEVHQMDVRTAFLTETLHEEIFMVQPERFEEGEDLVCRLQKSLYGLKQSSRAWNDRFHTFVTDRLGFKRSESDQCLYTRKVGKDLVILVLYVDDVVIASTSLKTVEDVKKNLSSEFEMTDVGRIRCFLGIQIERDMMNGVTKINQCQYLEGLLKRFRMEDCKPTSTPIEVRLKLPKGEEAKRTEKPYRELVGCLTYASLTTRPDLAAAVNFFSQYQSCPTDDHWTHLKRILRYIKGTLDWSLVYSRDPDASLLEVFSDADWANDPTDRRSVSGGLFKFYGCTVGWLTRKQQTVALSSTEAELTALCNVACHAIWLTRLLQDLGLETKEPIVCREDNQSTIRVSEDSKDHGRLKHVDVKYHFLRDLVVQNRICLKYIRSEDQPADVMTKGLPKQAFRRHCAEIGLTGTRD